MEGGGSTREETPEFARYSATSGDFRLNKFLKMEDGGSTQEETPKFARYSATSGDFRLNKFLKMEDGGSTQEETPKFARYSATSGDFRLNKFLKMEDGGSKRKGKRIRKDDDEDYNLTLASTQEEIPEFARVLVEALKMDVCPYLKLIKGKIKHEGLGKSKSLLPKLFSEDLLNRLICSNPGTSAGSSTSPPKIRGSGGTKSAANLSFSGEIVKGEGG